MGLWLREYWFWCEDCRLKAPVRRLYNFIFWNFSTFYWWAVLCVFLWLIMWMREDDTHEVKDYRIFDRWNRVRQTIYHQLRDCVTLIKILIQIWRIVFKPWCFIELIWLFGWRFVDWRPSDFIKATTHNNNCITKENTNILIIFFNEMIDNKNQSSIRLFE